jgi:hypothetical protein
MKYQIGTRVGAILSSNAYEVQFLGYGVYEADRIPVEAVGWLANMCREMQRPNPCILLDNGKRVYGCECWWGPEVDVRKMLDGRTIVTVDIETYRVASTQNKGND